LLRKNWNSVVVKGVGRQEKNRTGCGQKKHALALPPET
jgi:hypothetical protein